MLHMFEELMHLGVLIQPTKGHQYWTILQILHVQYSDNIF